MTDFFTMQPGETAAPVPPGPVLCTGTAGMRRIHRFFLWAYDEAPGLVRSVGAGDTARAASRSHCAAFGRRVRCSRGEVLVLE